jgi:hypothetical protein
LSGSGFAAADQPDALAAWILGAPAVEEEDRQNTTIITTPVRVQQRGQEMRLVFGAEDELSPGHAGLVRLLARANGIRRRLFEDMDEVAEAETSYHLTSSGLSASPFWRPTSPHQSCRAGMNRTSPHPARLPTPDSRLTGTISVAPSHQPDRPFPKSEAGSNQASGFFT